MSNPYAMRPCVVEERQRRAALIERMGGMCQATSEVCFEVSGLEFDHPRGRKWRPNQLTRSKRMERYEKDFEAGLLRLLCRSHNALDGNYKRWGKRTEVYA